MMRFIGFYDYTVILTYLSLLSAVLGTIMASKGRIGIAIICLCISGFCDAFDGMVARSKKNRTEDEKAFGIQIDSLCDLISFGMFPALLCYFWGMNTVAGMIICFAYILCAVIRLAFFNVQEGKRQQTEGGCNKTYRGMPVTTISMILPLVYLISPIFTENVLCVILHGLMLLVAFLFIYDVEVKKWDFSKLFKRKR